jgi:hypothetical protein
MNSDKFVLGDGDGSAFGLRTNARGATAFRVTKAAKHEYKAQFHEQASVTLQVTGLVCAFVKHPAVMAGCVVGYGLGAIVTNQIAAAERKKQQEALKAQEDARRKEEAAKRESEERQKEFAAELDRTDRGFRREWDSGRFMKEYRDPPMPREARGGRETMNA